MEPLLTITYFPFFFSFLHPYQKSTVVQVPSDQTVSVCIQQQPSFEKRKGNFGRR